MPSSLLAPFDLVKPSQIISQYSEWVFFALFFCFFLSVSGIILRKHFSRAYVKPLIISVSLMLTVGVFFYKETVTAIVGAWGIVGTILLVFVVAIIPYGLCRGFGLSTRRAFYLTYILFYILAWVQFPEIFFQLADRNLGLVNLGLLILFIVAIIKTVKFGKSSGTIDTNLSRESPFESEISQEAKTEDTEEYLIKNRAENLNKAEIKTVEDMEKALSEILSIVETHRNNLSVKDRERISQDLKSILKNEGLFKTSLQNIKEIIKRIGSADIHQIQKQKERLAKTKGNERKLLEAEIRGEEEKLKIESTVMELEKKIEQCFAPFNQKVNLSVQHMRNSNYPYDAKTYIEEAMVILKEIIKIIKEMVKIEEKLVEISEDEKKLLKKEKKAG
ncbi:MAG: hypothetical protein V1897_20385 [Pseudomonadota bacterium]